MLVSDEVAPQTTLPPRRFEVVAMVASLGGLDAFRRVLRPLPTDFPASIVLLQHHTAGGPDHLVDLLAPEMPLRVEWARQGSRLRPATIHVAPRDHHLVVTADRTFLLLQAEKLHFVRPAADVLLRSIGLHFGAGALVLVLTGRGQDGAQGCRAIRRHGGFVLAQDPLTCSAAGMPTAAFDARAVDFVMPLERMPAALTTLVMVAGAASHLLGQRNTSVA